MPRVLCEFICRIAGIEPAKFFGGLSDKEISAFAKTLCALKIPVDGFGGNDKAQVSSGGIRLSSLRFNCQLNTRENLYVIGEAVNVDGRCGGYNLQWAWSSAAAAAKGVASDV